MDKVLVIRFSSIGDILLTTPVLRALAQQAQVEVHVLTKAAFGGLLKGNPWVSKIHTLDTTLEAVIPSLKAEGFREVIDLHNNLRTLKVKKALGLPAHSFPKLNVEKWILVNTKINLLPDMHIVDRYFETVAHLGVHPDGKGLDYVISTEDVVSLDQLPPAFQSGYIAYAFGGQHDGKMASLPKMADICQNAPLPVVLLGGKEDAERGDALEQACGSKVLSMAGKLTLPQSGSLLQQSTVVLAHDTGLMHMAAALGKPIVSLWGGTTPRFGMHPYLPAAGSQILEEPHWLRPPSKLGIRRGVYRLVQFVDRIPTPRITEALKKAIDQQR